MGPVSASELLARAGVGADAYAGALSRNERERLFDAFAALYGALERGETLCRIYFSERGAEDFSAFEMSLYGGLRAEAFSSPSAMLEAFYYQKDRVFRLAQRTSDLRKLVAGYIERCVKKRDLYQKTLADISGRERFRQYGELITAYIHAIPPGAPSFVTRDFYTGDEIDIPLDPALTPVENAQKYFKRYNKEKRAFAALQGQIAANGSDFAYLESVVCNLDTAETDEDIAEIRAELADSGFLRRRQARAKAQKEPKKQKPLRYVSSDGFEIYVGKNNTQNDELTLRFAQNNDIWLHTKDIAGSHVIIKTNGQTPPDATLREAANLAAYYSRGRQSAQVPVDYVARRHVRKPNGAKPGFVIYDSHKTLYVTPSQPEGQPC
jgi:predicted ribosome quality control (RQC) complex YloA/Tae2 family protein